MNTTTTPHSGQMEAGCPSVSNALPVNILQVEYKQTLAINGKRMSENVEVVCKIYYEMLSTGWLHTHLSNPRSRGTDFMTLIALALHARPLWGADLDLLVSLGAASLEDEGRLYARVTDLGLSIEMGLKRQTVATSVARLAKYGLVDIYDLPPDFRDSKGHFAGTKAYLLSGELERILSPEVLTREVSHRVPLTDTVNPHRVPLTDTVDPPPCTINGHGRPLTVYDKRTHRVPLTDTNMLACKNNDDNGDNKAQIERLFAGSPTRHSRALTVKALTTQYPVQPDGLSPDQAFNLALDKALALLPVKLRKRADAPLYALAGELHPTAREHPSRAWPDAGGAGWILDAVLDAIVRGPVGSVNLFRTITDRWLVEGNPYAVKPLLPVNDPLAVFIQLADDDYTSSDQDRRHLSDLRAEGYSDDEIVAGIQRAVAGARQRGAVPRSFGYCVPVIREIPPSQPSRAAKRDRAAKHDRGTDPGAVTRTGEKAATVPPDADSVSADSITNLVLAADDEIPSPFDEAIVATWGASSNRELARAGLDLLGSLLGPGLKQIDLGNLLATIVDLGRRVEGAVTPDLVEAVVTGKMAMSSLKSDPALVEKSSRLPGLSCVTPTTKNGLVLAEVVGMYESEIGSVTERTVQRLMALTEEHRDIDEWREAFDAVVQSNVRRLDYLVKCLENAGKPKPRSKPGQRGRGGYQRPQRTIREKPPAEDVDAETRALQRAALAEVGKRQGAQNVTAGVGVMQ